MTAGPWVRVYRSPLRPVIRAGGLLWATGLLAIVVGGIVRAGGAVAVLLGVLVLPCAGYAYYRLARVVWRYTDRGVFTSREGVKVAYGEPAVIPWAEVAGFEGRPDLRPMGAVDTGYVLSVVRRDGSVVPTRISGGRPLKLFGRGTYERVLGALERELAAARRADAAR